MKLGPMNKKEMVMYGVGGIVAIICFIGLMMWMMRI